MSRPGAVTEKLAQKFRKLLDKRQYNKTKLIEELHATVEATTTDYAGESGRRICYIQSMKERP
jgi:hypothetical protein